MREENTRKKIFTNIYQTNHWGSPESVSGPGSELRQTEELRSVLPGIFAKYNIQSMLDIPCGDFNWMKHVDMNHLNYYTGADIVEGMVKNNSRLYTNKKVSFLSLDITEDLLPAVDLIFTRDCFVHLSDIEISNAIKNVIRSKSKYFLSTTYPSHLNNGDTSLGKWRPVNLNRPPFNLPPYVDCINIDFQDGGNNYPGNTMGLWLVEDLENEILDIWK